MDAINSKMSDDAVITAALNRAKDRFYGDSNDYRDIAKAVINSPKCTTNALIKIINFTKLKSTMIKIIESKNATPEILDAVITKIKQNYYSDGSDANTLYKKVIASPAVNISNLKNIMAKTHNLLILKDIISSSIIDTKTLAEVIKIAAQESTPGSEGKKELYSTAINSKVCDSSILCLIISLTGITNIIIQAVNSPVADDKVYDLAEETAKKFRTANPSNSDAIMKAVKEARNKNKLKPPIIPLKNGDSNNVKHKNNNKKVYKDGDVDMSIEEVTYTTEMEDNVTERIRRNVEDGMSTMLWGLSGIGKTSRVEQIDPTFTMIKLKNDMLPEEVTGGKEPNGEPGEMYPPNWYVKLCEKCEKEPDRMHILFIDEITNVKNNVKSLVWEIIEDRRVNGNEDWMLPDNCAIVAAGNRPEESTSVITDYMGGVLPEPLHDRFDFHIEIPLDVNEWQKWSLETNPKTGTLNMHPSVLSFCIGHLDKVMFSSLNKDDVTQPRLSPRRWAKLSKAIFAAEKRGGKGCHVSDQRITECIGKDIAPAFIEHYNRQPLNMEKVEKGLYDPSEFKNIDDKLFALSSLVSDYNGSEMAVEDFISTCLGDDYLVVYGVMKKQRDEATSIVKKTNNSGNIKK